jgi:dolichol-phosphate mannosyltransferase
MPTYNEANNLPEISREILAQPFEEVQLIIVDDNSPDGTGRVAGNLEKAHPDKIRVVHRPKKLGLGSAYALGFRLALDQGADVIVQLDADFSHSPDYIPRLVSALNEYDVAVGSRFIEGGSTDERWSWWRYLLSWWANRVYTRLILGIDVHDATAGFKAFRRRVLESIDFGGVLSNGYVFQVEMAYLCHKLGFRVLEIPIYFEDRRIGKSKMSVPIKLEAMGRVWQIRWRYRRLAALPPPP